MIIRGGENIYPKEIEDFIMGMPEVRDCQVVGVPNERYGEVPGAFIILHEGQVLTEDDVIDHCHAKMARYKCPKHFFFVKEFPLTTSGKIQKFRLREMAKEMLDINSTAFTNIEENTEEKKG